MNQNDEKQLKQLRVALARHDCRISSRTGLARCKAEVERITGLPLSKTPARLAEQINLFCARGISEGMPVRPFVPLVGYQAELNRHRALAEMTR